LAKKFPLHEAIKSQDVSTISRLLRAEATSLEDEFETSGRYLMRPIHFAVEYGHSESALVINLLAQAGAAISDIQTGFATG